MSQVDETVEKIKNLEIQGAQSIAIESLKVLRDIAEDESFGEEFDGAAEKLENARPTGVSAHNCIEYVKGEEKLDAIDEVIDYLKSAKDEAAGYASQLIDDGSIVLTHCHSSTVMETFRKAKEEGKDFKVIVTETEPKLQGLKTAKELIKMDIPVYYIVDSAAGLFMWAADCVFVGADSIKSPGILNKIGTYPISLAAKEGPETEFYFVATKDKFDYDNFSTIESRPPGEITDEKDLDDPDVVLENPAFDLTPWSCVDDLITEDGIIKRNEIMDLLGGRFEI